jgi:hypothetical protein
MNTRFPEKMLYDHWVNFGHLDGLQYFLCQDDGARNPCRVSKK